jgi:anti-sigma regulatory factor (Ser/Thr protein kinase)
MSGRRNTTAVQLRDESGVGGARRAARAAALALGFGDVATEQVAIVASEAARNVVLHGGGGEVLVTPAPGGGSLDLLALDRGPGIADLGRALRDGYSTIGTAGQGLGAISRIASVVDVYSAPGGGTALLARVGSPPASPLRIGALCVAVPPEDRSGDGWAIETPGGRPIVLVADGLGHGVRAAEAADVAIAVFRRNANAGAPADELVRRIHEALRPTRGAAIAVAEQAGAGGVLRYAGVGNISGVLASSRTTRRMVSLPGTAGHEVRTIRSFEYEWPDDGVLVMHSDGLATHWDLAAYPGLVFHDPALVAGVLYRDFSRRRDDACVVVVRRDA